MNDDFIFQVFPKRFFQNFQMLLSEEEEIIQPDSIISK